MLAFSAFTAVVEWFAVRLDMHLLIGLPFIVACGFVVLFHFRRCPICHRRLREGHKSLDDSRYKIIFECDSCQIAWDSGLIGDSRYDSY